jgi:hypothetical protein
MRKYTFSSFDEFHMELENQIQLAVEKKKNNIVVDLLKRSTGFVPTADQANLLRERLQAAPDPGGIEFAVSLSARLKRNPNRVTSALAEVKTRSYADRTRFQPGTINTWQEIRDWLNSLSFTNSQGQLDIETARAAFILLLQFREKDYGNRSFLHLLDRMTGLNKVSDGKSGVLPSVIGEVLQRRVPNKPQLKLVLRCGEALQAELQEALDSRRQYALRLQSLEEERSRLQASLSEVTADRDESAREVEKLTKDVEQLRADLKAEQSKAADTEKHWSVILEQRLAGLAADLKTKLRHETQEIELCLDRTTPNAEMALQRVRRIEQILQEVKQGE